MPGNDDAIRSVSLLTRVIADAVADGLMSRSGGQSTGDERRRSSRCPTGSASCSAPRRRLATEAAATDAAAAEDAPALPSADRRRGGRGPAAADAAPVPADEVPAVVAAEADAEPLPAEQGEHRTGADQRRQRADPRPGTTTAGCHHRHTAPTN